MILLENTPSSKTSLGYQWLSIIYISNRNYNKKYIRVDLTWHVSINMQLWSHTKTNFTGKTYNFFHINSPKKFSGLEDFIHTEELEDILNLPIVLSPKYNPIVIFLGKLSSKRKKRIW